MNAAAARVETRVPDEDRIARIESDVDEIKDDVKTINIRLNDSIVANAREFGAVRAELAEYRADTEKSFGTVRAETERRFGALQAAIDANRTETEKNFGSLRVEVEKIRTTIESAKFWIVGTIIGTAFTILGGLHLLKVI